MTTMHDDDDVRAKSMTVDGLLRLPHLSIPDYQRPYKWTGRNVRDLIGDIQAFSCFDEYRIGTVILHRHRSGDPERDSLDIVDGQQRILTFLILLAALRNLGAAGVDDYGDAFAGLTVSDADSISNMRGNLGVSENAFGSMADDDLARFRGYLLKRCTVTVITVRDLGEAFQLFDSQNARGKALYPTDLLKAFHIREMEREGIGHSHELDIIRQWESKPSDDVEGLFADYLYRIRKWSVGREITGNGFDADEIGMFKGIRLVDDHSSDNWAKALLYAKSLVDEDKARRRTLIDANVSEPLEFPYQINQPMINGESFFAFTEHYYRLCEGLGILGNGDNAWQGEEFSVITELDAVERRCAGQLKWTRTLFDCLLLAYVDRFGTDCIEEASEHVLKYVSLMRLNLGAVYFSSINKYAVEGTTSRPELDNPLGNLFQRLTMTYSSRDFLGIDIPPVSEETLENLKDNLQPLGEMYVKRFPRYGAPERQKDHPRDNGTGDDNRREVIGLIYRLDDAGVPAWGIVETLKWRGIIAQSGSNKWWTARGLDSHGLGRLAGEIQDIIDDRHGGRGRANDE